MFENNKIKLEKLTMEHVDVYHSWRNNTDVMRSTSPALDLYSIDETHEFIQMISTAPNAKSYMIRFNETNEIVGIISLINMDYKNRSAELIIDIGKRTAWGKGIGKSAVKLIMDYAFMELNLNRLYLQVFDFNDRAVSLYEKLGFVQEGRQREALYREGKYHDIITMSVLQNEYGKVANIN